MKRRFTIRGKLALAVSLIVFAAFFLCMLISYYYFEESKTQDAQNYLDTVTESIRSNLISMREDLAQVTTMPYYFGMADIMKKYANSNDSYIQAEDITEISNQLAFITETKSSIVNAYVVMVNGKLFTVHLQNIADKWDIEHMPWLSDCESTGALTMISRHDASYARNAPVYAVSFVRMIKDIWTMDNLGWLVIDLDADSFRMCVPEKTVYGESFYIFNEKGEIVFPYGEENSGMVNLEYLYALQKDDHLISRATVPQLGLTIIGILKTNQYVSSSVPLLRILLAVFLILLVVSIVMILLITRSLYKPVKQLHLAMQQLTDSNFAKIHLDTNSNDEISDLANGFNHMVDEIQRLLNEIQEKNLRERKILFSLLQGQMSPHFIYNSLETLGSMAMAGKNYQLADGISALGRLMRHLTDNTEQETFLDEEMNFVEDYIYIQNLATGLQINFCHDIDFSHALLLVPKFILQPLVENVYRYAGKGQEIELVITSEIVDEHLRLRVFNNGRGISDERLEQIRKRIYAPEVAEERLSNRSHGFALRNIHQRIQLLYGQEFGLSVEHCQSGGFEILIELPVVWERRDTGEDRNR